MVRDNSYETLAESCVEIEQGYLSVDPDRTVRIRIAGQTATLTVKTRNCGAVRHEWEYRIPFEDAREMFSAAVHVVHKRRFFVTGSDGFQWEVDQFLGRHAPLVVAEVELPAVDTPVELPSFVGEEVTGDARYYNSNLAAQA